MSTLEQVKATQAENRKQFLPTPAEIKTQQAAKPVAQPTTQKVEVKQEPLRPNATVAERNNNPGNLRSWEGYKKESGFAKFPDLKTGWEKLKRQVSLDANPNRAHTVSSFISKFAPKTENDTDEYVKYVVSSLKDKMPNISKNTPLSQVVSTLGDSEVAKVIAAKENQYTFKQLKDNNFFEQPTAAITKPVVENKTNAPVKQPIKPITESNESVEKKIKILTASLKRTSDKESLSAIPNKSLVRWAYEKFGNDEDILNVLKYVEKGGSISDLADVWNNYKAKKLGSQGSDLIGDAGSIKTTPKVTKAVSKTEEKNLVEDINISNTPAVDQPEYTSKSFAINLNSKKAKKFAVLDNVHAGSNVGNINDFYNNFSPVNGAIVFTAQNDVVSGEKPFTKIKKGDTWQKANNEYVITMKDNSIKVDKASNLKEGDQAFKLKYKVFSFDDFDIKDGKIKAVYDSNVNALVPAVKKSDNNTYTNGDKFIIGLTDKTKTPGYLPLDNATQYGKSRGGSFIIFSDDLSQQYMVGGSFKNLYDFYQDLKKLHPKKEFKVYSSDTGSYSNSLFPKEGKITGNVYKKSNNRNTWGNVQHIVLLNE